MYFKCFNCFPLDNNPQSTTNLLIIIGVSLAIALLIIVIFITVIIILIVRYNCCVKNKSQPSSTHQTQTVSDNPIFNDNGSVTMIYDDPSLYYAENDHDHLTSPTSHGHNRVILSEDIGTNITPLDTTYETIPSDVATSSEHYYYVDRPKSDSTAVYIVPNRDEGLSEQSIQLNNNVAYNSSTTQSVSSPNMGDNSLEQLISLNKNVAYNFSTTQSMSSPNGGNISLEQSISLNDNVAYNNFTEQSKDYLKYYNKPFVI